MIWEFAAVSFFAAMVALGSYSGMFQFAFGCRHGDLSRVFTINKRTYKVCYECGHEVDYSWLKMHNLRPVRAVKQPPLVIARPAEILFI
jgi:hypothetical protein